MGTAVSPAPCSPQAGLRAHLAAPRGHRQPPLLRGILRQSRAARQDEGAAGGGGGELGGGGGGGGSRAGGEEGNGDGGAKRRARAAWLCLCGDGGCAAHPCQDGGCDCSAQCQHPRSPPQSISPVPPAAAAGGEPEPQAGGAAGGAAGAAGGHQRQRGAGRGGGRPAAGPLHAGRVRQVPALRGRPGQGGQPAAVPLRPPGSGGERAERAGAPRRRRGRGGQRDGEKKFGEGDTRRGSANPLSARSWPCGRSSGCWRRSWRTPRSCGSTWGGARRRWAPWWRATCPPSSCRTTGTSSR